MDITAEIMALVPRSCPECGAPTTLSDDMAHLQCEDSNCPAKFARRLEIYAKTLDIRWFGPSACEAIAKKAQMELVCDIFCQDFPEHLEEAGISEGVAGNMLAEVEKARQRPTEDWKCIAACTPSRVGPNTAKLLVEKFGSVEAVLGSTPQTIEQMERTGPDLAEKIHIGLNDQLEEIQWTRDTLPKEEAPAKTDGPLVGKAVCVTGRTPGFTRDAMKRLIEANGGKWASGVSSRTHYLVTEDPDSGTGKAKKAAKFGTTILTTAQLVAMLGGTDAPPPVESKAPEFSLDPEEL